MTSLPNDRMKWEDQTYRLYYDEQEGGAVAIYFALEADDAREDRDDDTALDASRPSDRGRGEGEE